MEGPKCVPDLSTKIKLLLETITARRPATSYVALALLLDDDDSPLVVVLPDGRRLCQSQLYLEAIGCDPDGQQCGAANAAKAYFGLGLSIYDKLLTLLLPDGRVLNKQQLFLEVLRVDDKHCQAYLCIASGMLDHEIISLPDGRVFSKCEFYSEALYCTENLSYRAVAFLGLARLAQDGHRNIVGLYNRNWNSKQLFLEVLRCDPDAHISFHAYFRLGSLLYSDPYGTTKLPDGRILNQFQFFLETIRCNSRHWPVYHCLAHHLSQDDCDEKTVMLPDGRTLDRRQLILEGIQHYTQFYRLESPTLVDPEGWINIFYTTLARTLANGENVTLHNGTTLDKVGLLLEVHRIHPDDKRAKRTLFQSIPDQTPWRRPHHALIFGAKCNLLFATLLLGLQRLEGERIVQAAHHSMLEDMLECWTWSDCHHEAKTQ